MASSMNRWKGTVAIVTGASAGIGASIAERLVNEGLKVVGLARRNEKVDELAKKLQGKPGQLYSVKTDMTKEEDILAAFRWTKENLGPVHVLVNNAGIATQTNLADGDTKKWKEVLDTNVLGLCIATREALKDMRANKVDGHIFHINSISGHIAPYYPGASLYPASKHAVTALTETLRQELNSTGSKIKISSVSPGGVRTQIFETSGLTKNAGFDEFLKKSPMLDPEDIADAIAFILSTPPHVQIHEMIIKPVGERV